MAAADLCAHVLLHSRLSHCGALCRSGWLRGTGRCVAALAVSGGTSAANVLLLHPATCLECKHCWCGQSVLGSELASVWCRRQAGLPKHCAACLDSAVRGYQLSSIRNLCTVTGGHPRARCPGASSAQAWVAGVTTIASSAHGQCQCRQCNRPCTVGKNKGGGSGCGSLSPSFNAALIARRQLGLPAPFRAHRADRACECRMPCQWFKQQLSRPGLASRGPTIA